MAKPIFVVASFEGSFGAAGEAPKALEFGFVICGLLLFPFNIGSATIVTLSILLIMDNMSAARTVQYSLH